MEKARAALGVFKTSNRVMHCGPGAHALTFPVANNKILNVVAFVTDPEEWAAPDGKFIIPATKAEATKAFADFSPVVRSLMDMLPEELDKWGVFDMRQRPVPSYVSGRFCLAGDAAHASSPHHGAGAGCGIEDCLALVALLQSVAELAKIDRPAAVRVALQVYNDVRYDRSQWIMDTSRVIGDIYEFQGPESGSDREKIAREIHDRSHRIWDYDVDAMVGEAMTRFGTAMKEAPSVTARGSDSDLDPQSVVEPKFLSGFPLYVSTPVEMTLSP